MDLTWESLIAANSTLKRWRLKMAEWNGLKEVIANEIQGLKKELVEAINQDLDTPRVTQLLRKVERSTDLDDHAKRAFFLFADGYLGLELDMKVEVEAISVEITELLAARAAARSNKDFGKSDQIRDQLIQLGIEVQDSPDGQKWNRII